MKVTSIHTVVIHQFLFVHQQALLSFLARDVGLGWKQEKAWITSPRWAYKCGSGHWISNWDYQTEDLDDVSETIYTAIKMVCGDLISLESPKDA